MNAKRDFRVKRNGNSLQLWDVKGYAGSWSLKELCLLTRAMRRTGTGVQLAQILKNAFDVKKAGFGTKLDNDFNGVVQ